MVRLIDFSLEYLREHPEFIRMLADENAHGARHVRASEIAFRTNSPLLDLIAKTLDRGVAAGDFRDSVDPLELYISIAGMTFFYFANGLTMSAIFGRDLSQPGAVRSYRDHIVTLTLTGLQPQPSSK
jgi:TetR/AcrR family transcriptional regulator